MPLKGCYIDVKGAGESSVQCWCWHWLIQSEGRGPDPQLVQGSLIPWKSIVLLPSVLAEHLLFPLLFGTLQPDFSPGMDVRKETLSLPWWSGAFPWALKCLSGAGPSNPNTAAPEPRLSTQGAHLLIMLLHRFSGVTGAELGPLCPTQVTEETAAITRISLSRSNNLTGLASRHPSSCSPRALGVKQHVKVQCYFLHKWELQLGSVWGVHITYPSTVKHNRAPMRAENGFRKQSINLWCYLSDSLLISAGCC